MEYKKVEVFVPDDSQPHLCRITTNDYQTQIEWLEPIEEIIRDDEHKMTPMERIESFKKLFDSNPIDWTNYEQLAKDCWLFLTNDKLPAKATIKRESFLHEVKIMIESAVMFAGRLKSIEAEKQKDERIKQLEEFLRRHEQWEASVISDDSMWWPNTEKDALNGKIYDSFLELQGLRNKLLGKYIDGKCSHSYRYYQDKKVCHSCGHTVYGDFRE